MRACTRRLLWGGGMDSDEFQRLRERSRVVIWEGPTAHAPGVAYIDVRRPVREQARRLLEILKKLST